MSHADLVLRAVRWLYNTRRCQVVFAERSSWGGSGEACDAIGFRNSDSVQVECKVSRSDFLADGKKAWRHPVMAERSLGRERYFLTPKGLLKPEEIPEGWGLLEVRGKVICVVKKSDGFGNHWCRLRGELALLVSALNPRSVNKIEPTPKDAPTESEASDGE